MWIFTKCGFFSAVRHNSDKTLMHVRARFKGDLERLMKFAYSHKDLKPIISPTRPRISATPNADYAYRMDLPVEDFAAILAAVAIDVNYTNFKSAVHDGTERDATYMRVWSTMRCAQTRRGGVPPFANRQPRPPRITVSGKGGGR